MVYKIPTAFETDQRAEELSCLDEKRSDVLAEAARLEAEAWLLFVSLLIDEMLAKASELGQEGDLRFAVLHYFGSWQLTLATTPGTYFYELNHRLPNVDSSLEPFMTLFNKELVDRGVRLELQSERSWYSAHLVRI